MGYWLQRAKHLREGKGQETLLLQRGTLITWLSGDGQLRGPFPVDFVHTDEDGLTWVYVSWPGYQSAVNANVVTKVETV